MAEDFVIEMLHITKEFPGVKALDNVNLKVEQGEIHALIGENGAVTVYLRDGESFQPALTGGTGIANEIEYLVGLIESGGENYKNPPESAAQTVKLAEALCQSAEKGGEQVFL